MPSVGRARVVAFIDAYPASGKSFLCNELEAKFGGKVVFKDTDDISQPALAKSFALDKPLAPLLKRALSQYLRSLPADTKVVMCGVSVFDDAGQAVPIVPDLKTTTAPKLWLDVGSNGYSNLDVALARSVLREFKGTRADWKEARDADPSDHFFKLPMVTKKGQEWNKLFNLTLAPADLDTLRSTALPHRRTIGDYIDAMRRQYEAENIVGNETRAHDRFGFQSMSPPDIERTLRATIF